MSSEPRSPRSRSPVASTLGSWRPDRRSFLAAAGLGLAAAACGGGSALGGSGPSSSSSSAPASTRLPGPAAFVTHGPTKGNRVALTFHTSGDLGRAAQLLDVLAQRKVVMTAFIVGSWLDANPSWAQRLRDAGHELANHTYTHPQFESLSPSAMADEIDRCRDLLIRLTGSGGRFFRPSGTADGQVAPTPTVLDVAGRSDYPVVLGFDVDPLDYQDPGAPAVTQRTLAAVRAGSVVSLHFDHPGTVTALPAILDGLDERGLTPVTASKLLS